MTFNPDWLSLREASDHSARNLDVIEYIVRYFKDSTALKVTDLASGTGSTVRGIAHHLPVEQEWLLTDYDENLLARCKQMDATNHLSIATKQIDLRGSLDVCFENDPDLVTTSAFLDLVSKKWLEGLVSALKLHKKPFYAALSYDGVASVSPTHRDDELIVDAMNMHQRGDKGFGDALGPEATNVLASLLDEAGFHVIRGSSPWQLWSEDIHLMAELLKGWALAAKEMSPDKAQLIDSWLEERIAGMDQKNIEVMVGHDDLFAYPKF